MLVWTLGSSTYAGGAMLKLPGLIRTPTDVSGAQGTRWRVL